MENIENRNTKPKNDPSFNAIFGRSSHIFYSCDDFLSLNWAPCHKWHSEVSLGLISWNSSLKSSRNSDFQQNYNHKFSTASKNLSHHSSVSYCFSETIGNSIENLLKRTRPLNRNHSILYLRDLIDSDDEKPTRETRDWMKRREHSVNS